jgi:transcriptional antiterminator NusG
MSVPTAQPGRERPERYFVRAETRYERAAGHSIRLHGMSAMVPHTREWVRVKGGRKVPVTAPVMPGYLVLKAKPSQLPKLREIDHVASRPIMADGRNVRPMSASERAYVGGLVRNPPPHPLDPHKGVKVDPKAPKIKAGDAVRIMEGPFLGFPAKVEWVRIVAKVWMAKVEVMIFGRPTPVQLDAGQVALAV